MKTTVRLTEDRNIKNLSNFVPFYFKVVETL